MNRLLFTIGSILFTVSALGFLLWGRSIVDTFDVMTYRRNEDPLPTSTDRLRLIAYFAIGLSTATVLCCMGLFLSKSKQSITLTGREFIVGSAVAIIISAGLGAGVCWWADLTFLKLAVSDNPEESVFDPVLNRGGAMLTGSGGALVIAGIFLILASIFGFRKKPTVRWTHAAAFLRWLFVAIPLVLFGLIFAISFLQVSFHGSAALELITDPGRFPQPHELGSHLKSIYVKSQYGFGLLLIIGFFWIAAAFLATKPKE